jgi:CBS domain-containing protein
MRMGEDEIAATVQAFHFVQMVRLRNQDEWREPGDPARRNRLALARLNSLDQRILKEALRQARKLQNRVALEYQLA